MSCKIEWTREFLTQNTPKAWINKELKIYREDVLFDRELAKMPDTQTHVDIDLEVEVMESQITDIGEIIQALLDQQLAIRRQIRIKLGNNIKTVRREFVRKCPGNDCNGYLSTALKCKICSSVCCSECREIKDKDTTEHVCDPGIVVNIKAMEKDTKPCPGCSSLIHKIDGCNQIWCVLCNTAFDWASLRIETGQIHNPHYFEYLRRGGGEVPRNPDDVRCGQELTNNFISRLQNASKHKSWGPLLMQCVREVQHIRFVEIRRVTVQPDTFNTHISMRKQFIRGRISKEQCKKSLQQYEKKNLKYHEQCNVYTMYSACITDILYRMHNSLTKHGTDDDLRALLAEIVQIINYSNECLDNIKKTFGCVVHLIPQLKSKKIRALGDSYTTP
jgi:hypothetical protein